MNPKEFVEWYYKKFKKKDQQWPTCKEDHIALIELIEKYSIKSILEIGTWFGWTTLLMWLYPNIKKVKTIELGEEYGHLIHKKMNKEFYGSYFRNTPVKMIFCDSTKFKTNEKFDMVFIDGDHDCEHVEKDTKLALGINPKIIVWHDYPNEEGVKNYLNNRKIESIKGSLIAYEILK